MELRGKRVVMTGATGFIGRNTAKALLESGAEVFCLVRPGSPNRGLLPEHEKLTAVEGALDQVESAVKTIGQADAFFHFAWGGVNRAEIDSPVVQQKNVEDSLRMCARLPCARLYVFPRCGFPRGVWNHRGRDDGRIDGVPSGQCLRQGKAGILSAGSAVVQRVWDDLLSSALFQRLRARRSSVVDHLDACA